MPEGFHGWAPSKVFAIPGSWLPSSGRIFDDLHQDIAGLIPTYDTTPNFFLSVEDGYAALLAMIVVASAHDKRCAGRGCHRQDAGGPSEGYALQHARDGTRRWCTTS